MNRFSFLFVFAAFATLFLSSCEVSFSTASIQEAKLTKDEPGTIPTTVFGVNDVVYLKVKLANAPDDTVTEARWIAADVNAEGIPKDYELNKTEITQGTGELTFNLSNDQVWPTGSYRVEILMNGELTKSIDFAVE